MSDMEWEAEEPPESQYGQQPQPVRANISGPSFGLNAVPSSPGHCKGLPRTALATSSAQRAVVLHGGDDTDHAGRLPPTGQWLQRDAYRVKAPEAEKAQAVRQLAHQEEKDFQDFRRARAQMVTGTGTWGDNPGSAPVSLQQGREALLAACQKEARAQQLSKVQQRLRRKQEAEHARAEELAKGEKERRLREEDFYKREQAKAARIKQEEVKKKEHWQAWAQRLPQAEASHVGSSTDPANDQVMLLEASQAAWPCGSCTLVNKASSAACEACSAARDTAAQWQCSTCTLLNPASQPVCTVCAAPSPSARPMTSAPNPQAARPPSRLSTWLKEHRLEQYEKRLTDLGYEMEDLDVIQPAELEELFEVIGVSPPHKIRFRNGLKHQVATVPSVERPRPECPVCLEQVPSNQGLYTLSPCGHVFCHQHALVALGNSSCSVCRGAPERIQQLFF